MILLGIMLWIFVGVAITTTLMPTPSFIEFVYSSILWPITLVGIIKLIIKDRPK